MKNFVNCRLSLHHSNPNEKSRKQHQLISFVSGDHSWLYDDTKDWQQAITLSQEMFELIKYTAVPISAAAVNEFSNSRKLDILNYFLYQNYNLNIKKFNYTFKIEDLYHLFGGGIPNINEFRRVFKKTLEEIKQLVSLDITAIDKFNYLLVPSDKCLLTQHERRKTFVNPENLVTEEFKRHLNKEHERIDVEAANIYLMKRAVTGNIRNPHAYLRSILKNPNFYYLDKLKLINDIHKSQFREYENISDNLKKINLDFFRDLITGINIYSLPPEIRPVYEQLRNPSKGIIKGFPGFNYCCYIVWAYMQKKRIEFAELSPEKLLINFLKHVCP